MHRTTLAILALAGSAANANTLLVPAQHSTIQAAINAAAATGDEILVSPGTYNEFINFNGKAVRLRSTGGASVTTIHAPGNGTPVVQFVTAETAAAILEGFTINGGTLISASGAGVRIQSASPTIQDCRFTGNTLILSPSRGAGLSVDSGSPVIRRCTFTANNAGGAGDGTLALWNSSATVDSCTIDGNIGSVPGVYIFGGAPRLSRCTISNNSATDGPGAMYAVSTTVSLANCLFNANHANAAAGAIDFGAGGGASIVNCTFVNHTSNLTNATVIGYGGAPVTMTNSIVAGPIAPALVQANVTATYCLISSPFPGAGNISGDPMFVSASSFALTSTSPCLDAGNNAAYFGSAAAGLADLAGKARGYDALHGAGTGVGQGPLIDMGAYEWECYANCNNSTESPILNVQDFTCFLNKFAAGCP